MLRTYPGPAEVHLRLLLPGLHHDADPAAPGDRGHRRRSGGGDRAAGRSRRRGLGCPVGRAAARRHGWARWRGRSAAQRLPAHAVSCRTRTCLLNGLQRSQPSMAGFSGGGRRSFHTGRRAGFRGFCRRTMVSSCCAVAVRAIPANRASGSRVRPCTMSETTMTAVASTRTRSRRASGAPLAVVSGIDRAAASGTTPRVPAQDTTAGTAQDGRRMPERRWLTAGAPRGALGSPRADAGCHGILASRPDAPSGGYVAARVTVLPAPTRPLMARALRSEVRTGHRDRNGHAERPASLRRLRALVMVFGPRRPPSWPGICGLVAWLAARFAAGR